jgi:pyruvate/2-oxoglutarate dehydrogenase complex dihydrolipoamide acyltransferase (E2) component
MVVAICSINKKKVLNKDGSYTEKSYLPLNFTCDHRFIDGVIGAKLVREVIKYIYHKF